MDGLTAVVNKIIPFSSVDGPGNRTAVFLQGCNFSCLYCHNPETINRCSNCGACVAGCPAGALSIVDGTVRYDRARCVDCDACFHACEHGSSPKTAVMTVSETVDAIRRNMPFIRGITVSGGECTCQKEFLCALLKEARALGLDCYLDSNGSLDFEKEQELLAATDGVMLDVKAFDPLEHRCITGCGNETVLQNLRYLASAGKLYEIRTVVVPGLFDVGQTVLKCAKLALPFQEKYGIRYKLIQYRSMGVREPYRSRLSPPSSQEMERLKGILEGCGWKDIVVM